MDISFSKIKLEKIINDERKLVKKFGQQNANQIMSRMIILSETDNLAGVSSQPPERIHPLKNDRKGQYAVDLKHPYRLIFEPDHDPIPTKDDGGVDLEEVTAIIILEITDYH